MIKRFTFFIVFVFINLSTTAQLSPGSLAPNFTGTDLDGNEWTLYDILDEGKSVLLDFSATWCEPCWDYHNQGVFKSLYTQYGPDGTDEMMLFFIEPDSLTNHACLFGEMDCDGGSLGNWIDGTNYPIIENVLAGELYNVVAFPTLYHICPSRTVTEFDFYATEDDLYELTKNCPQPSGANNASIIKYAGFSGYFCNSATITPSVDIQNFGTDVITEVTLDLYVDDILVESINWSESLETFELKNASFSEIMADSDTEIKIEVTKVNNQPDEDSSNNEVTAQLQLGADLDNNFVTLELLTDDIGAETYWELIGEDGTAFYTGGNPVAVGGIDNGESYDDNEMITAKLPLPADGCYELKVYDLYGDGICCYYGSGYFSLLDSNGELIYEGGEFGELSAYPFAISSGEIVKDNASIVDFINRKDNFCFEYTFTPQLTVQNVGGNEITSLDIDVIGDDELIYTHTWSGNATSGDYLFLNDMKEILLDETTALTYTIKNVNGNTDENEYKNSSIATFDKKTTESKKVIFEMQLDDYAHEIYWQLSNGVGDIIASGGNETVGPDGAEAQVATPYDPGVYSQGALISEEFELSEITDCYELLIVDDYGDGIFDPYYAATYYRITDEDENVLYNFEALDVSFSTASLRFGKIGTTSIANIDFLNGFEIFPNPALDNLHIELNLAETNQVNIEILNALGQQVKIVEQEKFLIGKQLLDVDISDLKTGMHFIRLTSKSGVISKKFNVIK